MRKAMYDYTLQYAYYKYCTRCVPILAIFNFLTTAPAGSVLMLHISGRQNSRHYRPKVIESLLEFSPFIKHDNLFKLKYMFA